MQRYRARPMEVEAVRWDGTAEGATPIIDWVLDCGGAASYACLDDESSGPRGFGCNGKEELHVIRVKTIDGNQADVMSGWWMVKGTEGEFYPCKDSVFERKYEEAS